MVRRSFFVSVVSVGLSLACNSDLDCSLNGSCDGGSCTCDKPWSGPLCGTLMYQEKQPISAKNLYPHNDTDAPKSGPCVTATSVCNALNTWNGPIVEVEGKFHMFNPLYKKGSLLDTQALMYGVSSTIEGPYEWESWPDIGSNPALLTFSNTSTGQTSFALFSDGKVRTAASVGGPYTDSGTYPGSNAAPLHINGSFYLTNQGTSQVWRADSVSGPWTQFSSIDVSLPSGVNREDPFLWADARGNWHVINHAYNTAETGTCGSSTLSAHLFSPDGKNWHAASPFTQPYSHTVTYEDGTSHTYSTLERPNAQVNSRGQLTSLNLAADLMTQDGGCAAYSVCPAKHDNQCSCVNCKYADHAGTVLILLDV